MLSSTEKITVNNSNESYLDKKIFEGENWKDILTMDWIEKRSGKFGTISFIEGKPWCLKKIKINDQNSAQEYREFEIQKTLKNLHLRVPCVYGYHESKVDNAFYILMEKINGVSPVDIMNKSIAIRKSFIVEKLWFDIEMDMLKMHDLGYAHMDLEGTNMIFNLDEKLPYILDFGKAIKLTEDNIEEAVLRDKLFFSKTKAEFMDWYNKQLK